MEGFTTVSLLLMALVATCTARSINFLFEQESSSSEQSAETKEVLQQLQTICYERTGSNQTVEALFDSFKAVPECVFSEVDIFGLTLDFEGLNESNRQEFFPKYCPQMRNALPCFKAPMKAFSKCLDDYDTQILYAGYNATAKVLDLICENYGENPFRDGNGLDDCLSSSQYWDECANLVSDSTNVMEISSYGQEECRELSQVRNCVQDKLNECKAPSLMDLFDVYWDALMENSPCREFVSSEPDRAS